MIPALRRAFNASWSEAQFAGVRTRLEAHADGPLGFPISETPCFFPRSLMTELSATGAELAAQALENPAVVAAAAAAVPERFRGPGAEAQPTFLQVDFGLVSPPTGGIAPKLVELQAFASLYGFQLAVAEAYRDAFSLAPSLKLFLGGLDKTSYLALVGEAIVGGHDPNEVVLMEIDPRRQKTWPDFAVTEAWWGVRAVDTAAVSREGRRLYYQRDGRRVQIKRVYNRVIPDELERKKIQLPFDYRDDLDLEWAGHPSWYFRISKFSIPWLRHPSVPQTWFLHELDRLPDDREKYLLKPLFSFAGGGIIFAPTDADIAAIPAAERHHYILQERIEFSPVIETPDGATQAEIRMMYVRTDKLRPVLTLIRMGRGKMMGVDHNRGFKWVGASAALIDDTL
ncbi:MAG: hypothetical protein ABI665_12805 [Vicinamibacterales bacterium]